MKKERIILLSTILIIALMIILLPNTKSEAITGPRLTDMTILTNDIIGAESVLPGDKVQIYFEGETSEINEIHVWITGEEQTSCCNVFNISNNPYFYIPNQATEGNIWTVEKIDVIYKDESSETYGSTDGYGLNGNRAFEIINDANVATLELKSNEAKEGEKVYLDFYVPNKENVTAAVLWFDKNNDGSVEKISTGIYDINNNPYIIIDDKEKWGTTRNVFQLAVWRNDEMGEDDVFSGDRLTVNSNYTLTLLSKEINRIDIQVPIPIIGDIPSNSLDNLAITVNNSEQFGYDDAIWTVKDGNQNQKMDNNQIFEEDKEYGVSLSIRRPRNYYIGEDVKVYVNGNELNTKDPNQVFFGNYGDDNFNYDIISSPINAIKLNDSISYASHIQNIGWEPHCASDGKISGTTGRSLRLEAVKLNLIGDCPGNILYRTHIQNIGWENNWKSNGTVSGTEGKALRLEAIEIKLDGIISEYYDVYYRVHAENYGWLDWAKNGEPAGTQGFSYRLEALQVVLVKKGEDAPGRSDQPFIQKVNVLYTSHVQNIGWQNYVKNGEISGTEGQSLRLEGLKIKLGETPYSGDIVYNTHVQNIGWQNEVKNGAISGTEGQGLRLEALTIRLTGELAKHYCVRYRVHIQDIGWQNWKYEGAIAGTTGQSKRIEAIEIELIQGVG